MHMTLSGLQETGSMVGGDRLSWGHIAVVPCGCPSIFLLLPALGWKLVRCPGPKCALKGRGRDPEATASSAVEAVDVPCLG